MQPVRCCLPHQGTKMKKRSLLYKRVKTDNACIEAFLIKLSSKNLILLKGSKGYVMCGYLNLRVAEKFKDLAIKITGVSTIEEALKTTVHSCTSAARKSGIYKGQPVKEALRLIV